MRTEATRRPGKAAARSSVGGTMRDDVRAFKREIILAAAIDAFYSQGFENTSVDDIAAAMSVTKAVLYYNFASKMEVLETIVDRTTAWSLEAVERGIAQGSTPARKLALFAFHTTAHILEHQKLVAIYFREERSFSPALLERARDIERKCVELVTGILDEGVASGDFELSDSRLMAINLIGMISQAFYWYREEGRLTLEDVSRHFADAALALVRFKGEVGLIP
jgi:TetR/AcrR family transcriptional regulator, cholesterol catabolism regulator